MDFDEWVAHSGVCVHVKGKVAEFSNEFPRNPLDSWQSFLNRHNIAKKNFLNWLHQSTSVSDNLFLLIKSSEEPFWQQSWRLQFLFIRQSRKVKALFEGEHAGPGSNLS